MRKLQKKSFAIVGAGLSGCVLAYKLGHEGHHVTLFEARNHIAGNCYTERCPRTGILIHKYGPHIFHTDDDMVWEFVNQFTTFLPFTNRVKANYRNKIYSLPINLHTINQFFATDLSPSRAKIFIQGLAEKSVNEPVTFEEQALSFVGRELYESFFYGYTLKQWGIHPRELPASILKRLPLRFNYDDNYFNHKYQGMPVNGYTEICDKLVSHGNINLLINRKFEKDMRFDFDHVFYTGPLDSWFGYEHGRLGYRTLKFVQEIHAEDYQGCAVMNYADVDVPFTRITEHKHFSPWEKHDQTVIFKEFSSYCGEDEIPYYPIRLVKEKALLERYVSIANAEKNVSFLGRLGTYRYLDMDVTIKEALSASSNVIRQVDSGGDIPVFFNNPL